MLPSFLAALQPQARQAGLQLRMLARLPASRQLAEQLLEASAREAAAAASAAAGDPWAGVDTTCAALVNNSCLILYFQSIFKMSADPARHVCWLRSHCFRCGHCNAPHT